MDASASVAISGGLLNVEGGGLASERGSVEGVQGCDGKDVRQCTVYLPPLQVI
jgi:hypothetical protein